MYRYGMYQYILQYFILYCFSLIFEGTSVYILIIAQCIL